MTTMNGIESNNPTLIEYHQDLKSKDVNLGEYCKALRGYRGFTQPILASKAGCDKATICLIEKNNWVEKWTISIGIFVELWRVLAPDIPDVLTTMLELRSNIIETAMRPEHLRLQRENELLQAQVTQLESDKNKLGILNGRYKTRYKKYKAKYQKVVDENEQLYESKKKVQEDAIFELIGKLVQNEALMDTLKTCGVKYLEEMFNYLHDNKAFYEAVRDRKVQAKQIDELRKHIAQKQGPQPADTVDNDKIKRILRILTFLIIVSSAIAPVINGDSWEVVKNAWAKTSESVRENANKVGQTVSKHTKWAYDETKKWMAEKDFWPYQGTSDQAPH